MSEPTPRVKLATPKQPGLNGALVPYGTYQGQPVEGLAADRSSR
jgi:hypothetical protein